MRAPTCTLRYLQLHQLRCELVCGCLQPCLCLCICGLLLRLEARLHLLTHLRKLLAHLCLGLCLQGLELLALHLAQRALRFLVHTLPRLRHQLLLRREQQLKAVFHRELCIGHAFSVSPS